MRKKSNLPRSNKPWSQSELDILHRLYPDHDNAYMAEILHRTARSIGLKARSLGIYKTPEFAEQQKRKGQFKPGSVPKNKGMRWEQFMTEEGMRNSRTTLFKAGVCRPDNPRVRKVGHETVRTDTNGRKYIYIKIAEGQKMVLKHRWVWEQAHGAIPNGWNVQFKDGDTLNCELDNLYIISRSEQLVENRHRRQSPERKKEIIARATATRNATIRRDRLRMKWGLEPFTKLVKHIPK